MLEAILMEVLSECNESSDVDLSDEENIHDVQVPSTSFNDIFRQPLSAFIWDTTFRHHGQIIIHRHLTIQVCNNFDTPTLQSKHVNAS